MRVSEKDSDTGHGRRRNRGRENRSALEKEKKKKDNRLPAMKAFAGQVLIFKRPPALCFFLSFFSSSSPSSSSCSSPSSAYIHAAAVQADWRFIRFGACLVACVADHVLLLAAFRCFAVTRRSRPSAPVPQLIHGWLSSLLLLPRNLPRPLAFDILVFARKVPLSPLDLSSTAEWSL